MATLFNTKIKDTYQSLLKLEDNTILTTTSKNITDGLGNASPLYMSTTQVRIGSTSASALYWDNVNNRLGIGTSSPIYTLEVQGNGLFKTTTSSTPLVVAHSGSIAIQIESNATGNRLRLSTLNTYASIDTPDNYLTLNPNGQKVNVGTSTNLGASLGIKGSGSTSATTSLLVQNSSANTLLQVLDNGLVYVGTANTGLSFSGSNTQIFNNGGSGGRISFAMGGVSYIEIYQPINNGGGFTSGTLNTITTPFTYTNTSGAVSYNLLSISPGINNTGTYVGTIRGIYYNPSLTSLVGTTHIALETVTGDVLFGTTSGNVGIGSINSGWRLNVDGAIRAQRIDLTGSAGPGHVMLRIDDNGTVMRNNTFNINSGNGNAGQNANLAVGFYDSTLARLYVKGSGSTSATSSLLVQNSSANESLRVLDDGKVFIGANSMSVSGIYIPRDASFGSRTFLYNQDGVGLMQTVSNDQLRILKYCYFSDGIQIQGSEIRSSSNGSYDFTGQLSPSGSADAAQLNLNGNGRLQGSSYGKHIRIQGTMQLDSASNKLWGFYYNPTLTGAYSNQNVFAFQSTYGGGYFNTATPQASAVLQADSTTQGVLFPRMTTAQKLAIVSPVGGLQVFDTTLNQMSYYNGSAWINF